MSSAIIITGMVTAIMTMLLAPVATVIWDVLFMGLCVFGVKQYVISDKEKVNAFMKCVRDTRHVMKSCNLIDGGDDTSSGLLLGYGWSLLFVAWIPKPSSGASDRDSSMTIQLWTRRPVSCFTAAGISECKKAAAGVANADEEDGENTTMTLWEAPACYYNRFRKFLVSFRMVATPDQARVVGEIIEVLKARRSAKLNGGIIVLISGAPGAGKSKVAPLLARELCLEGKDPHMCKTFNPTEAGCLLRDVVSMAQPTRKRPFVVLMDEIDIILAKINKSIRNRHVEQNKVEQNKDLRTQVFDKATWNSLCDAVASDFENIVIVMTSNKTRDEINTMIGDESLLRDKRVHHYSEMNAKVE
jgi:hypothetical protein